MYSILLHKKFWIKTIIINLALKNIIFLSNISIKNYFREKLLNMLKFFIYIRILLLKQLNWILDFIKSKNRKYSILKN